MIDVASTVDVLERKIRKLIKEFYDTHAVFEHTMMCLPSLKTMISSIRYALPNLRG
jgi:hypothetical protein